MKSLELKKLILIGASTGGPAHLEKIVSALDENFGAAIVIAQHMGHDFIPSFAKRLNERSKLEIVQAYQDATLSHGKVFIVSLHSELHTRNNQIYIDVHQNASAHFNPDINALFLSATKLADRCEILAIILTGIGEDGAEGCGMLEEKGVYCIAESAKTAVVYGMPARAKEKSNNIHVKDLYEIITIIKKFGAL
ncbi:MAG: CheB methylesterase domain-containing protein [Sulfurimonadaceae bacterium]|nr:CheB methylesterase domain-containing protein [Sulfurimonadaceae bacterium]